MKYLITILLLLVSIPLLAQRGYWDAETDSIYHILATQRTDTARLRTIVHLLDITRLDESRERRQALGVFAELYKLNRQLHALDDAPYRQLELTMRYWDENIPESNAKALHHVKQAVQLFDRVGHPIPTILIEIAPLFNRLHQIEERFEFYRDKLAYYRVHNAQENMAACYVSVAGYYRRKGAYDQAISNFLQSAELFKNFNRSYYISELKVAGANYAEWGNTSKALEYLLQSITLAQEYAKQGGRGVDAYTYRNISKLYLLQQNYTKALEYANLGLSVRGRASLNRQEEKAYGLVQKSVVLVAMHNPEPAVLVLQEAQHLADSLPMTITGRRQGEFELDAAWAQYYESIHDYQRAEKYWQRALQEATAAKLTVLKWRYMRRLFDFYGKRRQDAVAQQYARDYLILSDTLNAARGSYNVAQYDGERIEKAQNAQIANLRQERAVQAVRLQQRNILLAVSLIALVVVGSLGGFIYWQLRIHKQTLQQLRKTQNQLVQSEKWAFVGEVSAGIAHELQNPLNFMKKFAEVSTSMVDDINHRDAGKNAGLEQEILSGLRQNLQEISQHGMRASSIIKDMLEHSRAGTGQREPTNLNALISEYLQLACQSHVPAEEVDSIVFDMQLTSNLPLVPVVPADMGRVLLNLCTNALYAVCQHQLAGDSTYQPTISLSTHAEPGWVEVRVRDNGPGIASEVQAKVFQPFFTTKPIGEGTGLGLSISHDIVKAHGGTFSVASREGEYTEFVVRLPA